MVQQWVCSVRSLVSIEASVDWLSPPFPAALRVLRLVAVLGACSRLVKDKQGPTSEKSESRLKPWKGRALQKTFGIEGKVL